MLSGELELDRLDELGDEEVIEEIVAVRGLGQWTAEMFLLFHLERPDVLSGGDLGIRKAIQIEYGLEEMPTPQQVLEIGEPWRPHRSLASLYLWESLAAVPGRLSARACVAVGRQSDHAPPLLDRPRRVVAIALGSVAAALVVHADDTRRLRTQCSSDEAVRAAHQAEARGRALGRELASAAAFFQAEGNFSQHEFEVDRPTRCSTRGRSDARPPSSSAVPGAERAALRTRATASRSRTRRRRAACAAPRPARLLPVTYAVAEPAGAARRSATTSAPTRNAARYLRARPRHRQADGDRR